MDFPKITAFLNQIFPGTTVSYSFDEKCLAKIDFSLVNGQPRIYHHAEYNKVLATVSNGTAQYIDIPGHRDAINLVQAKAFVAALGTVSFSGTDYADLLEAEKAGTLPSRLQDFATETGMTTDSINTLYQAYKSTQASA